jgi:hypothetical protein
MKMTEFQIDKNHRLEFNKSTKLWDYYKKDKLVPKKADRLFKYYTLSVNNIGALLSSYFYLSNPGTFNDPFDCNVNIVTNNDENELKNIKGVKRNDIGNIGIVSFSEVIDSHLMWAHYTNNYRGFAIEFKGTEITVDLRKDQIARQTLTKVIYPKKIKTIKRDYPFAMHYVLSTKMKHWQYEKEWRIICELTEKKDRILNYYPEKVKALYVGHQLIDENESAYRLILEIHAIRFPEIPVFVVYPHEKELKLCFEKVMN